MSDEMGEARLIALDGLGIDDDGFDERYRRIRILGEGGMGEVSACLDKRIGRETAMKMLHPRQATKSEVRAAFLREAQVQGQLEHQAIPPVYDLGRSPTGPPFFTMRRVRGTTLRQVLLAQREGDEEAIARWSLRKLLTAFSTVCLAVDYANQRGVLHCDLKPSNVMLGEFGEVFLLDWGLASTGDDAPSLAPAGKVMGTPGYIAPERLKKGSAPHDVRSEVYALGTILFELISRTPLHPRKDAKKTLKSTVEGADARPTARAPELDLPPELDAICVVATSLNPAERYKSVRQLHDAIERHLDGHRDEELRRKLASEHAAQAGSIADRALASEGAESLEYRRRAMREVSRALALDPGHEEAMRTMARLLLEPPEKMPPEAREEMEHLRKGTNRSSARAGAAAYLSMILFMPLTLWMGIRDVGWFVALVLTLLAAAAMVHVAGRMRRRVLGTHLALLVSTLAIAMLGFQLSPWLLVPLVAGVNTMAYSMQLSPRWRPGLTAIGCTAFLIPLLLEWVGLVPASYAFGVDSLQLLPRMHGFPPAATTVFLLLASFGAVVIPVLYGGRFRDALAKANERLYLHGWHMRQFVTRPAQPGRATTDDR